VAEAEKLYPPPTGGPPAGLDYFHGPVGQKIYYLCSPKALPSGKPLDEASAARERIIPCTVGVSAQGYLEGRLTLPSTF